MDLLSVAIGAGAIILVFSISKIAFHKGIETELNLLDRKEAHDQRRISYFSERLKVAFPEQLDGLTTERAEILLDE